MPATTPTPFDPLAPVRDLVDRAEALKREAEGLRLLTRDTCVLAAVVRREWLERWVDDLRDLHPYRTDCTSTRPVGEALVQGQKERAGSKSC